MAHRREETAPMLDEVLFADDLHAAAYRALRDSGSLAGAIDAADPGAAALLQRIAVEDASADPEDVAGLLAGQAASALLREMERQARQSGTFDQPQLLSWLKLSIEELGEPDTRAEATERLVAWLAEQPREELAVAQTAGSQSAEGADE